MQNKAQQGNNDPIPTPERELERYGVWVKAEPQDVVEEQLIDRETLDSASVDGSDAVLLSEEEEDLLDSFDLSDESGLSPAPSGTEPAMDDFESLSPLDEMESIEDVETFELEALEPEALELEAAGADDVLEEFDSVSFDENIIEESVIDVALDELEEAEPEAPPRPRPADGAQAPAASDGYDTTEVNMEDFGFADDGSSSAGPSLESMGTIDALEELSAQPSEAGSGEFESLDMDLQFDDTIPSSGSFDETELAGGFDSHGLDSSSGFESVDLDSIGAEEAPKASGAAPRQQARVAPEAQASFGDEEISLDSFIDEDVGGANGIMPELQVENVSIDDGSAGFDDVRAVSDDLSGHPSGTSSDLLQKIALELSSIKEELVSLRSQLSGLKASGELREEPVAGLDETEEAAAGGFFDDEDDDTIALTGDELDNILNTADFTEEPAADEAPEDMELQLELPSGIQLLPEDGIYSAVAGIETIDLPAVEPTVEELTELESFDGVTPITSRPEDTSFLDAEETGLELDGMPLEDVPLVEPNPSDLDTIIDSAFGNDDEDLPAMEPLPEDSGTAEFGFEDADMEPELVLDIDADEQPVVSTVDSFPESLEEIDDALELEELSAVDEIGGMDLHSEEAATGASNLEPLDDITPLDEDMFVDTLSADAGTIPQEPASTTRPVEYHPDDVATSLDDSLFVDAASPVNTTDTMNFEDEIETIEELDEDLEEMEELVEEEPVEAARPLPATEPEPAPPARKPQPAAEPEQALAAEADVPDKLKHDVKSVLQYLDQLLASLPEEKIEEFASSEYYDTYKRLFDDLGLI